MIKKELGSFNFAFDMKNFEIKDKFFDIGMFELGFQARDLIRKPGKYAMKLIVTELLINEPIAQEIQRLDQITELMSVAINSKLISKDTMQLIYHDVE